MTPTLPAGLGQTFRLAAAELGFYSATRLFIEALGDGPEVVEALRDLLGREYPVLDAVSAHWHAGIHGGAAHVEPVTRILSGCQAVVVVGLEADFLDPLVEALPEVSFKLLAQSPLPVDWARVASNYDGHVIPVSLEDAFAAAGSRSAVLCFAYGDKQGSFYVPQAWLRFFGRDTRSLFRSIVAWNAVPVPFAVYPRWLAAAQREDFTDIVANQP